MSNVSQASVVPITDEDFNIRIFDISINFKSRVAIAQASCALGADEAIKWMSKFYIRAIVEPRVCMSFGKRSVTI